MSTNTRRGFSPQLKFVLSIVRHLPTALFTCMNIDKTNGRSGPQTLNITLQKHHVHAYLEMLSSVRPGNKTILSAALLVEY